MTLNFEIFYIFFLKIDKQIQKPLRQAQLDICCIYIKHSFDDILNVCRQS